ncbi:MAG TPA: O-antigen ligase family protein [Solirubrobacteraceae bacterium]|jgi:UDP-GlcNAc:undecaprenyl-phosphate GlcNAc-1-phosphate transferase
MTLALRLSLGFAIACALAYLATPYAIALADRLQFYDKPAGYKGHLRPTPYLGGAAVMAGLVVALALAAGSWQKTAPLLAGVVLLFAVGTIDDRRTVSPALRVLLELALAVLVWATGLGWHLHAGAAVDLSLTCLWVVGVVNAFNLFDNMDGAASAMALVVSAGAALIGIVNGDMWLAVGAACLCGACLGFLPRNISVPARIFLGDGGSMPMGFVVAVLVMVAAGTTPVAWRSLLVALLLVGIPALDTTLVIVSRRRRGVSVLWGGRDHLTHRARKLLPSARAVALLLASVQAALSVVAVLASRGEASFIVISASIYLLVAGCAIVLLDTQKLEEFTVAEEHPERSAALWSSKRALTCLGVVGLGAGLSPFFFAYYDAAVWVPVGLGVALLCAIAVVIRPTRPALPAVLSLGGLLGLGLWSLASAIWAESVESAVVGGNRWLVYGALLLLMLVLVSHDRRAAVLLGAAAAGIAVVALSVLGRLLGGDPGSLFLGGRLNSPLGYINGEGCLFAMGLWPFLALAESRRAAVAGAGAAMATLLASLALLSQSRGTALALLGSLILVLAIVPGRTRRIYTILVVAAGVAVAAPDLLHVYDHARGSAVAVTTAHAAGRAALLAALAAGVVWGSLSAVLQRLGGRPDAPRLASIASWALAIPVVVVLAVAAGSSHRIQHDVSSQWHAFVRLGEPADSRTPSAAGSNSRLLSGAGNRYDYWRIAWSVWKSHPVIGVGAGNFSRPYFQRRATAEDVDQPHSLELQALSDLGLVGALLLGCFIVGVLWGAMRMRRGAARAPLRRALLTAGLGTFSAWLVQASVDWMQLLPGLTAIALAGAAVLVWPRSRPAAAPVPASEAATARWGARQAAIALGVSAVVIALIATGASLTRQGLAQVYRSRAQSELTGDPAAALADANRSLDIDADSTSTYYVKAAALARFDQATAAEGALLRALRREPENFVTWALLGDIAVRERRLTIAHADYVHAHQLNPRNATLRELARNPRTAPR